MGWVWPGGHQQQDNTPRRPTRLKAARSRVQPQTSTQVEACALRARACQHPVAPPQPCARDDDCTQAAIPTANRSTAVTGDSAHRNHTADTPGPAHQAYTREWWRAGRALTTMFMAWTSILNKSCPCEETLSTGGARRGPFTEYLFCSSGSCRFFGTSPV